MIDKCSWGTALFVNNDNSWSHTLLEGQANAFRVHHIKFFSFLSISGLWQSPATFWDQFLAFGCLWQCFLSYVLFTPDKDCELGLGPCKNFAFFLNPGPFKSCKLSTHLYCIWNVLKFLQSSKPCPSSCIPRVGMQTEGRAMVHTSCWKVSVQCDVRWHCGYVCYLDSLICWWCGFFYLYYQSGGA